MVGRRWSWGSTASRSRTPRFGVRVVKGYGRDLGIGRRQGGEEGRLAGVGQADEPDVGDEPELEPQLAILARLALLGVARRSMGGRREVDVAQPAAPAAGDHHPLAGGDEVRDQVAAALVEDAGPRRHGQLELGPGLAMPPRSAAAAAGTGLEVVLEAEVRQGRLPGVDAQVDRSATAAISAIRPAPRDVRFASERRGTVATVAGPDEDRHTVKEHRGHRSSGSIDGRVGPRGRHATSRTSELRSTGQPTGSAAD